MSSSGGRTKKRGRPMALTVAGSPLVGRNSKRVGKSPGSTSSPRSAASRGDAMVLATDESDIVLDRLGKEIVTLLRAGGSKKNAVRRRLRLGINEVSKFLEATATAASFTTKESSSRSTTAPAAIVLVCRDVRPPRLVEHLHELVSLTATPHLVLSAPSSSLGRVLGCKTMAALAICPARCSAPAPPDPLPSVSSFGGVRHGDDARTKSHRPSGSAGRTSKPNRRNETGCEAVGLKDGGAGVRDTRRGDGGDEGGGRPMPAVSAAVIGRSADAAVDAQQKTLQGSVARDGAEAVRMNGGTGDVGGAGSEQDTGGSDGGGLLSVDRAAVDEDVDSFVEFLRRKVRAPPP